MCKVLAISNMEKVKITKKFISIVRDVVTDSGDQDGFGYAIMDKNHSIGGERTLTPEKFAPLGPTDTVIARQPFVKITRNVFGKSDINHAKAFIAHGRYSTNEVNLDNTHPFYNGNVALIHNGVVRDPDKSVIGLQTTCDTEIILKCWEKNGMKEVQSRVVGYYALAVLDSMTGLLHIVRDDRAGLYTAYSSTIDSFIFATTPEIIKFLCKEMKWKFENPEEFKDNMHLVLDGNSIMECSEIQPRVDSSRVMGEKEMAALGISPHATKNKGWVYDSTQKRAEKITAESDEVLEPSYRENYHERFMDDIYRDNLEKQYIDDGCPDPDSDMYEVDTDIDDFENGYGLLKKKIS